MLPHGWADTTLDAITCAESPICYGVLKPGDPNPGGVRMVRVTDIRTNELVEAGLVTISDALDQEFHRSRIKAGDVLISVQGTVGRVAVVPENLTNANISRTIARIRPVEGVEPSWLWRALRAPLFQSAAADETAGTTRDSLNIGTLRELEVPLPPFAEQRRIVAKLDALTNRLARARAELDRVPVLATNLRAAALAAVYERLSTDAELSPIKDLISSLDQGWSPKCENFPSESEDQWAVLKTTAIQALEFRPGENKALPADLKPRPKIEVAEGDILVTRAGPRVRCGITCIVGATRRRLMLADKMYRLRAKAERARPEYLAMMLNAPQILAMIEDMKTGISDSGLNLTQEKFLSLPIPAVGLDVQATAVAELSTAFARADRFEAEATRARALLDRLESALLAKAFRGELVPQDPNDEPAQALLDRIRAQRAAAPKPRRGGKRLEAR